MPSQFHATLGGLGSTASSGRSDITHTGLGRQRQVCLIPLADETQGVQIKTVLSQNNACYTGAPQRRFLWRRSTNRLPLPSPLHGEDPTYMVALSPPQIFLFTVGAVLRWRWRSLSDRAQQMLYSAFRCRRRDARGGQRRRPNSGHQSDDVVC